MKRVFLCCLVVFSLFLEALACPVSQETAKSVAAKFMATDNLRLIATYLTDRDDTALYIYNTTDGFVIVAADDCETPIIGYSHDGPFDLNDIPVQMEDYLQNIVDRIQYGIDNQVVVDEVTARQWELVKATGRLNNNKATQAVAPLITAQWHQGCLYNTFCPVIEGSPCDHASVGCVAVAMGQIMHYWKFPKVGYGSHSFALGHLNPFGNDFSSRPLASGYQPNKQKTPDLRAFFP